MDNIRKKSKIEFFCKFFLFLRSYVTAFTVIFLLLGISAVNVVSKGNFQNGSILFTHLEGRGGSDKEDIIVVKNIEEAEIKSVENKITPVVKIASVDSNFILNSNNFLDDDKETLFLNTENTDTEITSFALFNGTSLMAQATYYDESLADNLKYGITKYIVRSGDTPSSIATSFGISTYTVLWANNLKVGDYIKPKQELEILPVTGIKHTIKEGDTVEIIAKKYKADQKEIIIFNNLPADGIFPDGSVGKILIIPNGKLKTPVYAPKPVPRKTSGKVVSSSRYRASKFYNPFNSHRFVYGQCTYYVASRVYVPWSGHAKSWLTNARAYGYKTGKTPAVGSIVVTSENRWYGHVAYVEAVSESSITISEMNYVGWNRKSVRVLSKNSSVIRGYIYMN